MTDTPTIQPGIDLATLSALAIQNGILAAEPRPVGEVLTQLVPHGWNVQVIDPRDHEDVPRYKEAFRVLTTTDSFVEYVERHRTIGLHLYGFETPNQSGTVLQAVLDDHVPGSPEAGRKAHHATLVLRRTPAYDRWSAVLGKTITQEQLLDVVDDGIGEIAEPDGATLRDLVANLHAIRTTEVQSVIRTGGEATLTTTDVVNLRAGKGNAVQVPEAMTLVFRPWTAALADIVVRVRIKPTVSGGKVTFMLTAPDIATAIADAAHSIGAAVAQQLEEPVLWSV